MEKRRCAACGQAFWPRPQVPQQKYYGAEACRRIRRRRWQKAKLESDADYRENQARAQRLAQGHRDYWRAYRSRHPQYCVDNRKRARWRQRERRRRAAKFAKMDSSGRFRLCLQVLTCWCPKLPRSLQRWTRGSWKSLYYQSLRMRVARFAKRGLGRRRGAALLALSAWTQRVSISTFTVWSCALPMPG
jgi:hypothetical protein